MHRERKSRADMLLFLSCLGGAILAIPFPYVGLPLSAAALAGLVYKERQTSAAVAAVMSSAAVGFLSVSGAAMLSVALAATLFAIMALRRHDGPSVALVYVPVLAGALALRDFSTAWVSGQTLTEYYDNGLEAARTMLATLGADDLVTAEAIEAITTFAPLGYVLTALVAAVPTLLVILWVGRRIGAPVVRAPRVDMLDFSPHVLWPLILALGAGAAAQIWGEFGDPLEAVALNLLLTVRIVLFVQGFAVIAAWLRRANIGRPGLILLGSLALLIDGPTWAVSVIGLLDFWINFRKLNRDGVDGSEPVQASSD